MSLSNIGKIYIELQATGAKQAEKDILNVESAFSKTAKSFVSKIPSIENFFKRWGVALGAVSLAAGGLYTLIKAGPVAYTYWEEFGNLMGAVSDTVVTALSPAIDAVLNTLWDMEGVFEKLPAPIQAVIGVLGLLAAAITTVAIAINLVFAGPAGNLLLTVGKWAAAIGGGIPAGIAAGIGIGLSGVWLLDKLNILNALSDAGKTLHDKVPLVFDLVKILTWPLGALGIVVTDIVRGKFDQILPDLKKLIWEQTFLKIWNDVWTGISGILDSIKNTVIQKWTDLKNWILSNPIVSTIKTIYESTFGGGRASGGPVVGGTPYMVGERGPELFIPNSGGYITPNSQLTNSGGQSITLINKVELDGRQLWQSVRQYSSAELRRLGGY